MPKVTLVNNLISPKKPSQRDGAIFALVQKNEESHGKFFSPEGAKRNRVLITMGGDRF